MARKTGPKRKAPAAARESPNAIDPDSLEEMSRDELLSLARQLVLDRPTKGGASPRRSPVDPGSVASSVAAALDYEWEPPRFTMSRGVGHHTDRARSDLQEKRWEDAIRGATGIINGYAEGYDPGFDEDGMLTYDLQEAIEIVDAALKHVKTDVRSPVFDALLGLWWADMGHGGVGLSDDVPEVLRRRASKIEKGRLAAWVEDRLPTAGDGFRREAAAHMFLELGGEALDDEAYLGFCLENGLHMERVERLLALGRSEDAARATDGVPHHRLTDAAELLVKAGHSTLAVGVVRTRLADPDASRFRDRLKKWLQGQAEAEKDLPQAMQLAWERFRERPSMETYDSLRKIARRTKSWPADEQEALALLRRSELSGLLTEVHLAERRVAEALQTLKAVPKRFPSDWDHDGLKRRVAHAAQKEFPEEARDLYLELADALIARKTRACYAQAVPLVKQACALDERVHGRREKTTLLHELRRRHGGLPALWDELRKAGVEVGP